MTDSRGASSARSITPPRWQLRVLNGPECGATYPVEAQLAIGRGAGSDLQLVAQEVSRHHARIERDEQGQHVLVDLGSSNGTYVDGELVRRRVLEPHAEITIADVELVYEPVPPALATSPVPDVAALLQGQPPVTARRHAPTTPVGVAVPAGAIRDRNGHALVFEHPEGGTYVGNLFADIVEYRTLHAQRLRGGLHDPALSASFERLKARLKPSPSRDGRVQRAFLRFGCWLLARLRLPGGKELPCHVCEVGVDGSRLAIQAPGLHVGTSVQLAVEVIEAGVRRSIVMPGRVAWIDGELVALAFSGTPRREEGRYAQQSARASAPAGEDEPTQLMQRPPQLRLASGLPRPTTAARSSAAPPLPARGERGPVLRGREER